MGSSNYLPGAVFAPEAAVTNFGTKAVSSQTVALPPLTGNPGLRNSFIVQSDATPGTFYSSVVAVGSSGFDLVEQIGKDEQIGDNGGGHSWTSRAGKTPCCYCSIIPRSRSTST